MAQPTLSDRLTRVEEATTYTKRGIDEIKETLKQYVENESALEIRISSRLDSLDKKYAFKWIETLIILLISGGFVGLVGYIIKTMNAISTLTTHT